MSLSEREKYEIGCFTFRMDILCGKCGRHRHVLRTMGGTVMILCGCDFETMNRLNGESKVAEYFRNRVENVWRKFVSSKGRAPICLRI